MPVPGAPLTDREIEALRQRLLRGSKEAAAILGLSSSGMRWRLDSARIKLGAETLEQAIYIATARGLLTVPELAGAA